MNEINEINRLLEKLEYLVKKGSEEETRMFFNEIINGNDMLKYDVIESFTSLSKSMYNLADFIENEYTIKKRA